MKKIFFLSILLLPFAAPAQIAPAPLDTNHLPHNLPHKGYIKTAIRWTDRLGENILLTTETGITTSATDEDSRSAELYAYHFLVQGDSVKQTWRVMDFVKDCPLDLEASFVPNTVQITDLNNDGIAEIWLMYRTVCHGDVSPATMKIIMYEGEQKYAVRGRTKVQVSENEFEGGEYTFDKAMLAAPQAFQNFAKALWEKNKN